MIHLVDTNYSIANPRSRHPLQVSRDQTTPSVVRFGRPLSSHVLFLLRRGIFCSTCSNFSRISSYYRHAPFEAGPLSCWIQWHTVAIRLMILGSRNGAANVEFRPKKAFFFFGEDRTAYANIQQVYDFFRLLMLVSISLPKIHLYYPPPHWPIIMESAKALYLCALLNSIQEAHLLPPFFRLCIGERRV